jgi:hypothetical protein
VSVLTARFSVCSSLSPHFICLLRSIGFINCSFSGGSIVCVCNPHRRVQLDKSLKGLVNYWRIGWLCCSAVSHSLCTHPSDSSIPAIRQTPSRINSNRLTRKMISNSLILSPHIGDYWEYNLLVRDVL